MDTILLCEILIKEQKVQFGMISFVPGVTNIQKYITGIQR
jgi:hypothetical protein